MGKRPMIVGGDGKDRGTGSDDRPKEPTSGRSPPPHRRCRDGVGGTDTGMGWMEGMGRGGVFTLPKGPRAWCTVRVSPYFSANCLIGKVVVTLGCACERCR